MFQAGVGMVTRGRGWGPLDKLETKPGHDRDGAASTPRKASACSPALPEGRQQARLRQAGRRLQLRTTHEEDHPVHLLVADTDICHLPVCRGVANPCVRLCPAAVY